MALSQFLTSFDRRSKLAILILADTFILVASMLAAYALRISAFELPPTERFFSFYTGPVLSLVMLYLFNVYHSVSRIYSSRTEFRIVQAQLASILVWSFVLVGIGLAGFPRSILVIYAALSILGLVVWRRLIALILSGSSLVVRARNIDKAAIFGAGETGVKLIESLRQGSEMKPVALFDDDAKLAGRTGAGLKIHRPEELLPVLKKQNVKFLLLAKPRMERSKRLELVKQLEPLDVEVRLVPDLKDIASGQTLINETRPIKIQDLLGREPVAARKDLIDKAISGKCVLITGAGGSIGSELVRQVLTGNPAEIILLEASEFAMFEIHREIQTRIKQDNLDIKVHPIMGSVTDESFLNHLFETWPVDIVFHAAAYKHVHLVEQNPGRAILNNAIGTMLVAQAAQKNGVGRFVLISTDKAVRPRGIMGGTKRLAELVIQAIDRQKGKTVFTAVRFGNVLDSSGSVVPLFREQITRGGPVTVTHRDVERFFMLIPEAAQLVVQAGAMAKGGEIFLLKMGDAVKIIDLARTMIKLAGYTVKEEGGDPNGEIEITITGLKKGEKMYEELFIGDNIDDTAHDQILLCNETFLSWSELSKVMQKLAKLLASNKDDEAVSTLRELCMHSDAPAQMAKKA